MNPLIFPALGFRVRPQGDRVVTAFGKDIGPLAGARAEVLAPTQHHRVGAATATAVIAGPAGIAVALLSRPKATAIITFSSGKRHERKIDGNRAVRNAVDECSRFNAMAWAALDEATEPGTAK